MLAVLLLSGLSEFGFAKPEVVLIPINEKVNLRGYLYRPASFTEGKSPGILYLHGGPDPAEPERANPLRESLLEAGYVVLDIDYRNTIERPGMRYPLPDYDCHLVADADYEDSIQSIHYLRKLTGVSKVSVVGASHGGIIATRLAFFFPREVHRVVNIEGLSGRLRYVVPENCRLEADEKHYPYGYFTDESIKKAAPLFSYYGTEEGFASTAGRGRLDLDESDIVHGYARVKAAAQMRATETYHSYATLPKIDPRHEYVEYSDGHFPKKPETLRDLKTRIIEFLKVEGRP